MGSEKATPRTRTPNASCSHAPPASPTSGVGTSPLDAAVLRDALPGVLGVRRSPAGLKLCRRRHRALLGAGLEPGPGACASHTPASVLRMRHPPRPSGVNHSGPSPDTERPWACCFPWCLRDPSVPAWVSRRPSPRRSALLLAPLLCIAN